MHQNNSKYVLSWRWADYQYGVWTDILDERVYPISTKCTSDFPFSNDFSRFYIIHAYSLSLSLSLSFLAL